MVLSVCQSVCRYNFTNLSKSIPNKCNAGFETRLFPFHGRHFEFIGITRQHGVLAQTTSDWSYQTKIGIVVGISNRGHLRLECALQKSGSFPSLFPGSARHIRVPGRKKIAAFRRKVVGPYHEQLGAAANWMIWDAIFTTPTENRRLKLFRQIQLRSYYCLRNTRQYLPLDIRKKREGDRMHQTLWRKSKSSHYL